MSQYVTLFFEFTNPNLVLLAVHLMMMDVESSGPELSSNVNTDFHLDLLDPMKCVCLFFGLLCV
jgi:hypothetical protein